MGDIRSGNIIHTQRLRLVPFSTEHQDALYEMDSDPDVMRYLGDGSVKTPEETAAGIERVQKRWRKLGYGWWAVFECETNEIIGAACLQNLANQDEAPLEIGWRLKPSAQGKGFATEAGFAAIRFAFEEIGTDYLVAVANPQNYASQQVMERLGMRCIGVEEHYAEPCVVYELHKAD
ncbi:GNAT family N-acetyltransferase [Halocynthiibacter namhaensis]|uniref:GNAT family N-acetyltransferase n=1 Tax=Halocynthiibacter namhaensis TaxID=1290553 RepID=UPI0005794C5A|nr:GNAT family N-acetyltransferase [Halocynthiibacter namhaensis]